MKPKMYRSAVRQRLLALKYEDNMEKQEKVFVNGFISKDVSDNAPDFILGNSSVNIKSFVDFLLANEKYAVNGWLNFTTKRSSKDNKRYTELDLYQYNKAQEKLKVNPMTSEGVNGEVINTDEIPF